jgi:hypothetical protein
LNRASSDRRSRQRSWNRQKHTLTRQTFGPIICLRHTV